MTRSVRRSFIGLSFISLALAFTPSEARGDAKPPPVTVSHYPADPHWVQGQVIVNAPPDVVLARLERVDTWPQILTDISQVEVVDHKDDHWHIKLETRTLGRGMLPSQVMIQRPERRVVFWGNDTGVSSAAYTTVRNGPTPNQSNVVYSFYIQISGIAHLIISESSLREKQEHMVQVTLEDIRRAYEPR